MQVPAISCIALVPNEPVEHCVQHTVYVYIYVWSACVAWSQWRPLLVAGRSALLNIIAQWARERVFAACARARPLLRLPVPPDRQSYCPRRANPRPGKRGESGGAPRTGTLRFWGPC